MDTTCEYCHQPFTPNPKARTAQRFCSPNHRVYFHREGGGLVDAPEVLRTLGAEQPRSLAAAITVLAAIDLPATAAIQAITVDRTTGHYPASWVVTVPAKSAAAAEKVRDKLMEAEDDLKTLRRKLEEAMKPTKAQARSRTGQARR